MGRAKLTICLLILPSVRFFDDCFICYNNNKFTLVPNKKKSTSNEVLT